MRVFWEITNKCNLKCIHCYNHLENSQDSNFREVINKYIDLRVKHVIIAGGEPFCLDYLVDVLKELKEKNISSNLITNGTLITKELMIQLIQIKYLNITISVDGLEKQHDLIRGRGSFEHVLKNIEMLIRHNFNIDISLTINKLNYKSIPEIIDFFKRKKIKSILFNRYIIVDADDKELFLNKHDIEEIAQILERYKNDSKVNYSKWSFFDFCSDNIPCDCMRIESDFITVKPNGDITLCPHLYKIIGNIFVDDKIEIIKNMIKYKKYIIEQIPKSCIMCVNMDSCMGGCKAEIYNLYKRFDQKSPACPLKEG